MCCVMQGICSCTVQCSAFVGVLALLLYLTLAFLFHQCLMMQWRSSPCSRNQSCPHWHAIFLSVLSFWSVGFCLSGHSGQSERRAGLFVLSFSSVCVGMQLHCRFCVKCLVKRRGTMCMTLRRKLIVYNLTYSSSSELGRPGIPGSNDLESALRRLALRRANDMNERDFHDFEVALQEARYHSSSGCILCR